LAAIFAWPLVEYAAHRLAMHGARRFGPRLYRKIHGAHHDHPRDVSHYPVPPVAVAASAALLAVVFPAPFVGGLLLCLAAYDLVHLGCHGLGPLRGRVPRAWIAHHAGHHADEDRNFAVTVPVLDRLFGTARQ
jgi:sterol desaturase/sphingolipid hydroxylase (fatty acid hydroxylase superfamily)